LIVGAPFFIEDQIAGVDDAAGVDVVKINVVPEIDQQAELISGNSCRLPAG
jgi:hypothetical protein